MKTTGTSQSKDSAGNQVTERGYVRLCAALRFEEQVQGRRSRRVVWSLVLALGLLYGQLLQSCASVADLFYPTSSPPIASTMAPEEYRIGVGDKLRVAVWGQTSLDNVVPVRPDGMISVPLLDDVRAAGLTVIELKSLLTQMLEEYIASPDVTVVMMEMGSKMIYVTGEVNRPGAFPLDREYRVLDALSMAGGFTAYANKHGIKIIRYQNETPQEFRFNYSKFIRGKAPQSNIVLRPGDTVIVSE